MTKNKNSSVAYIIGNGISRKSFNLNQLKDQGTTYGCNALYREFEPDVLVAVDDGIISEISSSSFPPERFRVCLDPYEPAEYNPYRPRMNAGMFAMSEAINDGFEDLVCLGFDFLVKDPSYISSNIFSNTDHYGLNTRCSINDAFKRIGFLRWFITKHKNITFTFAFPDELTKVPENFFQFPNDNMIGTSFSHLINNKLRF